MFFNRKKKESTKKTADKNSDVKNDTTESGAKIDVNAYDYYKLFEKYFKYSPDYEIHYEEALEYALKAAECGLESGIYEIGNYYLRLRDATDADKERVFNAFKAGADLGGIVSKFSLAKCYEQGAGTEVDIEKAIYWYNEVAKNDKESLGDEAKQKIEELKARNDSALAEKLAEKKAKEEAEARKKQKELDDYYNTEEGKQKLYNSYLSGALKGYAVSQYSLGICNREGRGTAVDKGLALRWFTAAAENGHLEAMYETAKCYENGEGTAVSKPMAFYWYLKAAQDGHGVSKNIVNQISPDEAIDYLNSVCKSENEKLSSDAQRLKEHIEIELYKDGAENGNTDAMRNLGMCYEEGLGTDVNLSKAFYWRTKAAEAGDTDSQYHLGMYYKEGTGTEKDEKQAFYWFRTASENGNIDAMYELASCYEYGIGTTADVDVAFYLFNELGLKEYLPAKYAMGDLIIAENLTSEQMEIALYWFEQAGEAGYRDSQGMLCTFYTYGINTVSKDEKKALYWLEKLAEGGDKESQREAYRCYDEGIGTAVDKKKAVYYLEKVGESGDMDAQIALYNIYLAGKDDIPKNDTKNFYWCYKLAEAGYEEAYVNLGISYLDGNGTARNSQKGFYWVKKAAEVGDVKGMEILSGLYRDGEGTDVDMSKYRYWQKMWKQSQQ